MGKFKALFVVNLKAMLLTSTNTRGKGKRQMSGIGTLALMAFLALYLSATYSFTMATQLAKVGMQELVLMMMPVLVAGMGVMYTAFAVQGVVFGGKDNDLMLALPVSAFQLMLARVSALVLENLVFSVFVMLPACWAYAAVSGGVSLGFVLRALASTVFLCLLPTTLSLIVGCALTWLSSRATKGKALVRNLLYLLFLGAIMALSFNAGTMINSLAERAAGIRAGFSGWGLPFVLYQQGVCGDWPAFLGFAALCLLPFLAAVWLFGQRYKRLVTSLSARSTRSDYKLARQTGSGLRRALLAKEGRKFFTSTMYFFNTGFGLILMLVGGVAALLKGRDLMAQFARFGDAVPVAPLLAIVILFCLSMSAVAASSISLEGKYLWILKESPASGRTVLGVKWGFELLLTLPCTLLCTLGVWAGCGLAPLEGAALLLLGVAFALFHAPFGLYVNLCFPKLDASNDTVVVKQSAAAMIASFVPMALILAGILLYALLQGVLGGTGTMLVLAVISLAAAAVCFRLVATRGVERFLELN